ncbi:MAG TPA: FAD-dependent monooxygenase [Terriglobia bacterium]|nr:FAD-dependent monooxygenase [Terriglobia bacterium]
MEVGRNHNGLVDLAIIGGGPAGTAAALEARRHGMKVAIWDRDRFPRDKVCGEFLSAESIPLLDQEIPALLERASHIRRSEFISPAGRVHEFDLPQAGRGLSRWVLDEAMWQAAETAGARARAGEAIRNLRRLDPSAHHGANWELKSENGSSTLAGSLLVACGRWWSIDGLPSPARECKADAVGPWMGAKAHFSEVAHRRAVEMYYFPGGYCGLAPIEDWQYNACCLIHRRLVRESAAGSLEDFALWLRNVAHHPALAARLHGAVQTSMTVSTAPLRPARRRAGNDGTLLAGDAAGFLDPFTGDGISMALHSGRLAAQELAGAWSRMETSLERSAASYRRRLDGAVRRSYWVAKLLRALVSAPAGLQSSAAAVLPKLGRRLLEETRWREAD